MSLNEPVLTGPVAGRTVTYGDGSSAELKLASRFGLIIHEPAPASVTT